MPGLEEAATPNRSLYQSLAYNSPISQYVGAVDLSAPVRELQSIRDKADLASGFVKPLQSLPNDLDRAIASDKYYKDKLEEISNYESPHAQHRAVRKLGQQYADDSITGERGHITQSYHNYNEAVKNATEKLDKGDIDEIGYWKAVHQPYSQFKGTTPNGKGGYNVFQGGKVGKYEDMAKGASDFAQQWSPDKGFKATVDGGYINERTREYVSKDEVLQQTYNYLATNPKFREQLSHYKEFHGKDGEDRKHNLLLGIAEPIANREAFDKYDGNMKDDPFSTYMRKKQANEEESPSTIGSSYIEAIDNPNYIDKASGIEITDKGLVTTGYKKIVDGREVPITEKEYKDNYNKLPKTEDAQNSHEWKQFNDTYKKIDKSPVDSIHLYKTNPDIKNIVDAKIARIGVSSNYTKNADFVSTAIKDYKTAVKKNAEISILQRNNDAEQIVKKGKLLEQQLQSGTFIPLDKEAKSLAKQKGGTLDYQQLTQDGWSVKKVESSGTIIGTGIDNINIGDAATITLEKNGQTKKVRVLSRTPEEEIQNSPGAVIANEISKIEQSGHDGDVKLSPNLIAKIRTNYDGGSIKQNIEYVNLNGDPIPKDVLQKHNINFRTPKELKDHFHGKVLHDLKTVGYGHRSKSTDATTDLNVEPQD